MMSIIKKLNPVFGNAALDKVWVTKLIIKRITPL